MKIKLENEDDGSIIEEYDIGHYDPQNISEKQLKAFEQIKRTIDKIAKLELSSSIQKTSKAT